MSLFIFTKILLLLLLFYLFTFFLKISLFFHVTGCSGMFRNVPECSMFRVLSTATIWRQIILTILYSSLKSVLGLCIILQKSCFAFLGMVHIDAMQARQPLSLCIHRKE